jgi:hypothetical protein
VGGLVLAAGQPNKGAPGGGRNPAGGVPGGCCNNVTVCGSFFGCQCQVMLSFAQIQTSFGNNASACLPSSLLSAPTYKFQVPWAFATCGTRATAPITNIHSTLRENKMRFMAFLSWGCSRGELFSAILQQGAFQQVSEGTVVEFS